MATATGDRTLDQFGQTMVAGDRGRSPRYVAEAFVGADDALGALETIHGDVCGTAFQTLDWLTVLYEELAPARRAEPRVVIVTDRFSGEVAFALPLLIERRGFQTIARFADLGVSDYCAPLLGPAAPIDPKSKRRAWRAAMAALADVHLINLERMPVEVGGKPNPLATLFGVAPSRQCGNAVTIERSVDDFVASRGKKFRKEAARCWRVLEGEGTVRFYCAEAPTDVARAFSALDDHQAARHASLSTDYVLDRPEYRAFYERIALDGSDAGLSRLFVLECGGEIIATLFGVVHDGCFTLLRIANAGEAWSHVSPGRLIILASMRLLFDAGIRRIDMGIGSYRFKSDFGVEELPLCDLIVARRLSAVPTAILKRTRARLRSNETVRRIRERLTPGGARPA